METESGSTYDAIVVGGGMAGLTAAAYLRRAGARVLLLEKEDKVGGLVGSFERGGFTYDQGMRAVENSGIVYPMLRQLGIGLEFLPSPVSVRIGGDMVRLDSRSSLDDYRGLLARTFPGSAAGVDRIVAEVARVMEYMDVLYGIDNPLFLDDMTDMTYMRKTLLPWLVRYMLTMPKVARLRGSVEDRLAELTTDRALVDLVAQHFFKKTPAYFALSYFSLYLDYRYPRGGTGVLPARLRSYIEERDGEVMTGARVAGLDWRGRRIRLADGRNYGYRKLVWAADQKTLYRLAGAEGLPRSAGRAGRRVERQAALAAASAGGDSVFTLDLALDLEPARWAEAAGPHLFHTPTADGLSRMDIRDIRTASDGSYTDDWDAIHAWTRRYLDLTTYEISCPVLRDPTLAPPGKTGLIVSSLMEHSLFAHARAAGRYDELKRLCADRMVDVLDASLLTGLKAAVIDSFVSTPLTIEELSGNADGAITGWAFTNPVMPAESRLPSIARSVLTPIPDVYQAGQWTFSPSGMPISLLTGKLAADRVAKDLRRT